MRASISDEQIAINKRLEKDMAAYFSKGGKIEDVPAGASGYGEAKAWKERDTFSINPAKKDARRGRR